nr:branched-chain amino acid ABC transporter permease [Lachnospiraceae bacterium]
SYGRAFKAIRDDDIAAEAMGINLFKTKQLAFVVSSFFATVAGGLMAVFLRSAATSTFTVALTYNILLMVVIGGIGSVSGSVLGAFLITAGQEWLRFLDKEYYIGAFKVPFTRTGFRMVIFSILLMLFVLFWDKGIMGSKEFGYSWCKNIITNIKAKIRRKKDVK